LPAGAANSLRPGETEADRDKCLADALPAGRADTAAAVLWLASPEAGFTVGHDLVIDGGATAAAIRRDNAASRRRHQARHPGSPDPPCQGRLSGFQ
jgi:NAD(P)-dependent dehydrogenase (short-subunit alcohol dehydrogenase family)